MTVNIPDGHVNLAAPISSFPITRLNGPGWRWELFVQGCPLRCTTNCLNEELIEIAPREVVPINDIMNCALQLKDNHAIEGITILGGEPFGQALALGCLAKELRACGLSIMTYSGYTFEALQHANSMGFKSLLANTDILVEGPFLAQYSSGRLLWRGSDNQRILLLQDDYYTSASLSERCFLPTTAEQQLTILDPYIAETVEIHWSLPVRIKQCSRNHDLQKREPFQGWNWCPECEAYLKGSNYILKGLIAVIGNQGMRLFGHQEKPYVERFMKLLGPYARQEKPTP